MAQACHCKHLRDRCADCAGTGLLGYRLLSTLHVGTQFLSVDQAQYRITRKDNGVVFVARTDGSETMFAGCAGGLPLNRSES